MSVQDSDLVRLIRPVYNRWIRPFTPKKEIPITNIPGEITAEARLFDISQSIQIKPAAVNLLRKYVGDGDFVVEIATGNGYFSSVCLDQGATVLSFEPQRGRIERARRHHASLGLADNIQIRHAVVENTHKELGGIESAEHVSASELPCADVLLLDCEGAERDILTGIEPCYDRILVEVHPNFGATYPDIKELLMKMDYHIAEKAKLGKPEKKKQFLVALGGIDERA